MRTLDIIPLYASLIESCKSIKKLKQVHGRVITIGVSHHDYIRAKLISSYATCAHMREAAHIFSLTNRHSTFLYNSMIRGYNSSNRFHASITTYCQMLFENKQHDRHTLPSVLKACAALSALHLARRLHLAVVLHGFSPDTPTCNALITMYSRCGDLHTARKVFDVMRHRDLVTWSAMIAGYGMHGNCSEVFKLFEAMVDAGKCPDAITFTAILAACGHSGLVDMGRGFFEMMKWRFGVRPGLEHSTCMVDMLGRAGRMEEAEELISRLDVEPDDALWTVWLGACKLHGKIEVAERVAEKVYGRLVSN